MFFMDQNNNESMEENLGISKEDLKQAKKAQKNSGKFKLFFKFSGYLFAFLFVGLMVFSHEILTTGDKTISFFDKIPIVGQIKNLAVSSDKKLEGEKRDRINILLLGMGGKNHQGGYLADTIILASIQPSTKKVSLISFPRDMVIPMEGRGRKKINNVNAYAEMEEKGSGGEATCQALGDILEMPIDYYIRADFQGFIDIIDKLGGVKVYVEDTLSDRQYPVMGRENAEDYSSRYEHLYLEKGWHEMDGELALKYARSRHAAGVQGSDFARARRQQKIMEAAKKSFKDANFIFKPAMVSRVLLELKDHVDTNLKLWEMLKLWREYKDIERDNITNKVLDNSPNGLLVNKTAEQTGAYILTPRSGDFAEIRYMAQNIFSEAPQQSKDKVMVEDTTIEVRNGTWINGLASRTAVDLEKYGFEVSRVGNSSKQNFQKSVIYDLAFSEKTESLKILKDKTGANVSFDLPEWLIKDIKKDIETKDNMEKPDFILILGRDADKRFDNDSE